MTSSWTGPSALEAQCHALNHPTIWFQLTFQPHQPPCPTPHTDLLPTRVRSLESAHFCSSSHRHPSPPFHGSKFKLSLRRFLLTPLATPTGSEPLLSTIPRLSICGKPPCHQSLSILTNGCASLLLESPAK